MGCPPEDTQCIYQLEQLLKAPQHLSSHATQPNFFVPAHRRVNDGYYCSLEFRSTRIASFAYVGRSLNNFYAKRYTSNFMYNVDQSLCDETNFRLSLSSSVVVFAIVIVVVVIVDSATMH